MTQLKLKSVVSFHCFLLFVLWNVLELSLVECRSSVDARVLTGSWNRIPDETKAGTKDDGWTIVKATDTWLGNLTSATAIVEQVPADQPALYLLPPPLPSQQIPASAAPIPIVPNYIVAASNLVGTSSSNHHFFPSSNHLQAQSGLREPDYDDSEKLLEYIYGEAEKPFVPLNIPSIANHRLTGNWSEEIKVGGNAIQSSTVTTTTALNPVYPGTAGSSGAGKEKPSKLRRKVNVEKFRECIFFRICKKSECFHFGRFGVCQGY